MNSDNCIFCKIIKGEIPSDKVFESENIYAFRDINPCAPRHILVIPKIHKANLNDFTELDRALLGDLLFTASQIARQEGLSDYRSVINTGAKAGQTVFHLHLHLIGGRDFNWPPG